MKAFVESRGVVFLKRWGCNVALLHVSRLASENLVWGSLKRSG